MRCAPVTFRSLLAAVPEYRRAVEADGRYLASLTPEVRAEVERGRQRAADVALYGASYVGPDGTRIDPRRLHG